MLQRLGMYQLQTQRMIMTPQLRQALQILQLPTQELLESIRQEMENNPLLDCKEYDLVPHGRGSVGGNGADIDPLSRISAADGSLERHLLEQLNCIRISLPGHIRRAAAYLAGNLDDNGYLAVSPEEAAEALRIGRGDAERALALLQSLEPPGIGARSLQECLLLQARRLPDCPPLTPLLIEHHLHDIAFSTIPKLAQRLKKPADEVEEAVRAVKRLNPKPGASFHTEATKYVVPDVSIEPAGGRFAVRISEAAAPRLFVNGEYAQLLQDSRVEPEAKHFLAAKYKSARFLIDCIEKRRRTLLRVTEAIAEEQAAFLSGGPPQLVPLTLTRIAEKVGLHESTVSRSISGKYARTPQGVFELKYFFPSGISTSDGEPMSSLHVKMKLKAFIDAERAEKPHSDQRLAELLSEQGISISRRTVMKYREELGILSSIKRKR